MANSVSSVFNIAATLGLGCFLGHLFVSLTARRR
jgi:hypothetical protein